MSIQSLTVFVGSRSVAAGDRAEVAATLRDLAASGEQSTVLVFDDATGEQVDIDVRESTGESAAAHDAEPQQRGPGRPKLGVVAREVTLLPRHWEWLSAQPGGASVALRKLVEQARRDNADADRVRRSQEATFRFMTAMAGDEPGFEEACRALYAGDRSRFESFVSAWPVDVGAYTRARAADAFVRAGDES